MTMIQMHDAKERKKEQFEKEMIKKWIVAPSRWRTFIRFQTRGFDLEFRNSRIGKRQVFGECPMVLARVCVFFFGWFCFRVANIWYLSIVGVILWDRLKDP